MSLLMAAAVAMQAATPLNAANWFKVDDYPLAALRQNEIGYVGFAVLVGIDGKPEKCTVVAPTPFDDLNKLTCLLVMRRARFKAAAGADGQPSYGIYRSRTSWLTAADPKAMERLKKAYPPPSDVDLTLTVNIATVPPPIELVIGVDSSGTVHDCKPEDSNAQPAWVKVACTQMETHSMLSPAITAEGQAAASVQTVKVAFEPQGAPAIH